MGDEVRSIGVKAQNNEMRMKIISYNAARIASLAYSLLRGFLQGRFGISECAKDRLSYRGFKSTD
jgi:hypothetical protein